MSNKTEGTIQETLLAQADRDPQPELSAVLDRDSVDLTVRFLVGLLALGGDEAGRRLQDMQRQLDIDPTLWESRLAAGDRPLRRQAWHLGIGLMTRGQRRLRSGIRRSVDLSLRAAGRVSSASDRWGASRLTRPVRKPIAAQLEQWREEAARIIREGEVEEQQGRALATGALGTLTLEVMDEIAENPDMQEFVQDLIGQQGVGMATSVMDNARSVTLTADDTGEALLRWLLRRKPRRELPSSPVEGQRQTMYVPTTEVEREASDVD